MKDYVSALQSQQQALNITLKLHGDEHPDTAQSYYSIGITQHEDERLRISTAIKTAST